MRNVTITLDDETARWARVEAAQRDMSVSRFVGEALRREMLEAAAYGRAESSYSERGSVTLSSGDERYPTRDEVHAR